MKNAITYRRIWNPRKEPDGYKLPPKCLSYSIENKGDDNVIVADSAELQTEDSYPVEHHVGYFHKGIVPIRMVTSNNKPNVHFRITVEE